MNKRIYVGNLPFSSTEEELRELFEGHGTVHAVTIVTDATTGRSRGFGFVEMGQENAKVAIQELNGTELGGRTLRINEARERGARRERSDW